MANYQVTPLVQGLPATVPFVGPETQERLRGSAFRARVGANENVFGPSPRVIEIMQSRAKEAWMYGDPEFHELRIALAEQLGVAPENVMVGEGIDGLLGYIVRMFVERGDAVVTSAGAYPTFNYHVQGFGGIYISCPTTKTVRMERLCFQQRRSIRQNSSTLPIRTTRWVVGGMRVMLSR